jgi:hypothetical protein
MIIHIIDASSCAYPMLLFSHPEQCIWSPYKYKHIDKYGLYPTFEKAGISPDVVLNDSELISLLPVISKTTAMHDHSSAQKRNCHLDE